MARTTQDVIDQAIGENRRWETVLLLFAVIFLLIGAAILVWSIVQKQGLLILAGSMESILSWPAWTLAARTRKDNIMLRMLEIPLSKAKTGTEAAEMLHRVFEVHFLRESTTEKKAEGA